MMTGGTNPAAAITITNSTPVNPTFIIKLYHSVLGRQRIPKGLPMARCHQQGKDSRPGDLRHPVQRRFRQRITAMSISLKSCTSPARPGSESDSWVKALDSGDDPGGGVKRDHRSPEFCCGLAACG